MATTEQNQVLPTAADVDAAALRLAGVALRTPLVSSPVLDALTGGRVFLKCETLQRTGSFKFRGAYNRVSCIPAEHRAGGVVAFSSGNHAQGVAAAAKLCAMPAVIVMPTDAPRPKRERTAALGAEVVLYDREREDREARSSRIWRPLGSHRTSSSSTPRAAGSPPASRSPSRRAPRMRACSPPSRRASTITPARSAAASAR